jgi:hypothetical protein
LRSSPGIGFAVAAVALACISLALENGQDFVVGVTRLEPHRELEAGGMDESAERLEARLALVALVCRDHRRRDRGAFSKLALADPGLQPCEL